MNELFVRGVGLGSLLAEKFVCLDSRVWPFDS